VSEGPPQDPLSRQMGALGKAPEGFDPSAERPPISPPPDVPPAPASVSPAEVRPGAGGGRGRASGAESGRGRAEGDPHWVWVPTSVLIASEAYWAKVRRGIILRVMEQNPAMEGEALNRVIHAAIVEWEQQNPEDARISNYLAFVVYDHVRQDEERLEQDEAGIVLADNRLYSHEELHFEGVRDMVEREIAAQAALQARSGARQAVEMAREAVARLEIAGDVKHRVLLAIAEAVPDVGEESGDGA
jgi:hypothetical protein